MIETSARIGMLRTRRRIIYRNIATLFYPASLLFERDRPDDSIRDECVAGDFATHTQHDVLMIQKDIRRFVVQDLHGLIVGGLALGGIAFLASRLKELVDFWIRKSA